MGNLTPELVYFAVMALFMIVITLTMTVKQLREFALGSLSDDVLTTALAWIAGIILCVFWPIFLPIILLIAVVIISFLLLFKAQYRD